MKNRIFLVNRTGGSAKQVHVSIRSVVNLATIRKEKRNGRDVVIVPSATLPDDIVMNGIRYPADEIAKSYLTLDRTPAPYGHPLVNGKFVSARDPEGINISYIGAHNENVRREIASNGRMRVLLDKVIDVEVANRTEQGRAVLSAIQKSEPIHTSTGLICEIEPVEGNDEYQFNARNIYFDHDAILLNEEGAATPKDGVGIFVNAKGEEIEVINSALDKADDDLDWAMDNIVRALERRQRAPLIERLKTALLEAFGATGREPQANTEKDDMADDKKLEELSATVKTLSDGFDKIGETIANAVAAAVKPLTDNMAEIQANQKAKDEAELAGLREKIVKSNLMDEDTAKELTLNAARKLAEKAKPGIAAPVNSAFGGGQDTDPWKGYSLNAHAVTEKKETA